MGKQHRQGRQLRQRREGDKLRIAMSDHSTSA